MAGRAPLSMLLLAASLSHAQSARDLLDQVQKLRAIGRIDQAQPLLERALAEAERASDRWAEAESRRGLGQVLNRNNSYVEGRAQLDRAYSIFESLGDRVSIGRVYCDYAFLAWVEGDRQRQSDYFQKALAEFTAAGARGEQALALVQLAPLTSDLGEKLKLATEGHRLAREAGDHVTECRALVRWGDTLFSQGKYSEAAAKFSEAAAVATEYGLDRDAGSVLLSLGRVYRAHGMHKESLQTYLRALEFNGRVGDAVQTTQTLNAISIAYSRLGDKAAELDYAQRALEMAKRSATPRLIRRQSVELGTIYRLRGDYRNAIRIYEEAIAAGGDPNEIPWRHLAFSYAELKDPRALETADRAVEVSRGRLPEFLPEALRTRALIRKNAGLLEESLSDIREGLNILEQQRRGAVATDAMKRGFAEENQQLFALAVDVLFQLDRAGEALEAAERARGRAFVDLLATRNTPVKPKHSEQLAALRTLDRELSSPAAIATGAETALPVLAPARGPGRPRSAAESEWSASDPELRSFVAAEPYSLKQFSAAAARLNSTILSYWVNRTTVYIWAVQPGGAIRAARVDVALDTLEKRIAETRIVAPPARKRGGDEREIVMRGGEPLRISASVRKDAWAQLYRWLVQPVRQHLPSEPGSLLTIIPHGPLFHLPFAALLDERNRYLVESFRIHYTPAGAVLDFTGAKRPERGEPKLLLVADPVRMKTPDGKPLPSLPGARREVQSIARLARGGQVTVLTGDSADEQRVRDALSGKTVIHFATHGVLRPGQPSETFLALAPPPSGSARDAWLTAGEVYEMDLAADLVALTACRSAAGRASPDGLIGLTRAFFYAGAPSVLASLWDAADEPSSRLAEDFYRYYLDGRGKSASLRQAQLRMIAALRAGRVQVSTVAGPLVLPEHPVFWAGFVLAGEP